MATLVALFVAALVFNLRLAGRSPVAWIDTFVDQQEVRRCVLDDACTLTGVSTSLPGQVHAVAWLEWRTLFAWLGLGLDGAHVTIQILNAVAALLVFLLASRLGGALAGTVAVWLFLAQAEVLVRVTALHNSNLLLFLGAVLALACTAVIERPGVIAVALAALVGAVLANVHLVGVVSGVSVVWVALLAPRRRWLLAAGAAAVFALASFLIAPPAWQHNLASLLQGPHGHPAGAHVNPANPLLGWSLFGLAAWLLFFTRRTPTWCAYRRRLQGVIAVIVPCVAVFLLAPHVGVLPEPKYLFHIKAASAVAAAVPLGAALAAPLRARWPLVLRTAERLLPLALVLLMLLPGRGLWPGARLAAGERTPTLEDLAAVAAIMGDEPGRNPGWIRRVRSPYGIAVREGLSALVPPVRSGPPAAIAEGGAAALLMLEQDELPDPLPPGWRVVRSSGQAVTVLVLFRPLIDWDGMEVCVQADGDPERRCEHPGPGDDARLRQLLPPAGRDWRGTLSVRAPLRRPAPGGAGELFMPRMPLVCGGSVAQLAGAAVRAISDGRRLAVRERDFDADGPPVVELQWRVGSPACDVMDYDGLLPFVVEGDADGVRVLEGILRKREDVPSRGGEATGFRELRRPPQRAWARAVRARAAAATGAAGHAPASEDGGPVLRPFFEALDRLLSDRCLTPAAGEALSTLVASGALQAVLGDQLALLAGEVGAREITLQFQGAEGRRYVLTLALPGARSGMPDGRGERFLFYLQPPPDAPSPRARAILLAAAERFDAAVPVSALGRCAAGGAHADPRFPRWLVLVSAAAQLLAVLAAIGFGLRAVPSNDRQGP